ncbi:hypothetical protein SAMN06296020_11198 [Anoxynatronum buryatiense]|uniref:Uncharacterized protein n=1 Tax=Anoxynatronum buryatiense TaxID=489973 RepID=A0AA45WYL8_9CLOT|nr:hypothetical protein SAMN06296020_11198 [Anoxynatronum buryatiense]
MEDGMNQVLLASHDYSSRDHIKPLVDYVRRGT